MPYKKRKMSFEAKLGIATGAFVVAVTGAAGVYIAQDLKNEWDRNAHQNACAEDAKRMQNPGRYANDSEPYVIPNGCYMR